MTKTTHPKFAKPAAVATSKPIHSIPLPTRPTFDLLPELKPHDVPNNTLMRTLHRCLSVKRPHGGVGESTLAAWVASQVTVTMIDGAGNIHIDTRSSPKHRTLLTAHLDTVHHHDGHNAITLDGKYWRGRGAALGADDGSGVALIMHLLSTGFQGYAVLFRGEECGGVGSKWLADEMPELLKEFDRAVAFDRAGYHDVITHQARGRCCSDKFAEALGQALTTEDFSMAYVPCDGGVYTDTAEFIHLIPECTNLSVGYFSQHGSEEHQDVEFLQTLANQLETVRWDDLPTERDPKVYEPKFMGFTNYKHDRAIEANKKATRDTKPHWYDVDEWNDSIDREILIDALDRASIEGSQRDLKDVVAELVYPDDPAIALRQLNHISTETIDKAYEMLWCADPIDVAEFIFNQTARA